VKLGTVLESVSGLSDELCIFARRPWSINSEAEVGALDDGTHIPERITDRGLEYFLEVSTAKEVLTAFGERLVSPEEKQRLLVYYAENDAYPDWIY